MRANGRAHTLLTLPTSWIRRVNLSGEMPSCPFLQVQLIFLLFKDYRDVLHRIILFNALQISLFLQVAGCVWERVWLRWSSFSSSPPSSSDFVSLLHLELQRMTCRCYQLWASPSILHLMSCVPSVVNEEESWSMAL